MAQRTNKMKTIKKIKRIRGKLNWQYNRLIMEALKSRYYCNVSLYKAYQKLKSAINELDYFLKTQQLKPPK